MDFVQDTNSPLDFSYNGYWPKQNSELLWPGQDAAQLLPTTGTPAGEVLLAAAPLYQAGPLGNYYLPTATPLYHAGGWSAGETGPLHDTTRVDQIKEGEEPGTHAVSIGLHYIADHQRRAEGLRW